MTLNIRQKKDNNKEHTGKVSTIHMYINECTKTNTSSASTVVNNNRYLR